MKNLQMKDLSQYIIEQTAQETTAGAAGAAEDEAGFTPTEMKSKHPIFWGAQSNQEIPFEDIWYYVVKGTDYDTYEQDIDKIFGMLAKGKFGKDVIVKTIVDNRKLNFKAIVDEETIFVYDRPKKTLYNLNDPQQYYKSGKDFADDSGLWGFIVVDDDTYDHGGYSSTRNSSNKKNQSMNNNY